MQINDKNNKMKFLITGGAGFIGSHIAEKLIESQKREVVVFDNLSVGQKENVPRKCKFIKGDIRDKEKLNEVMEKTDIVFHNAACVTIRGSFEKFQEIVDVNYRGTLNVLEAATKQKVKKIIFASSMGVYGEPEHLPVNEEHPLNPNSPYGFSKILGELYCQLFEEKYGISPIILRYFNTYGTKQTPSPYVGVITTFINQALNKKPLTVYGNGEQTRDFVWVEDVVQANLLAAFSDIKGIFNIGSGKEISINQIADLIIKYLGGEKVYLDEPAGEIKRMAADISKAKKLLKYKPRGEISELLPSLIDWRRNCSIKSK